MSPSRTPTSARAIVDELFGRQMTREIWTGNYEKALPLTVQDFDLFAVLPAVFYMFRFGQRRGKGKFLETFGSDAATAKERKQTATIERIATKLAANHDFINFSGDAEKAILGDLLLCFCLENAKRGLGRKEQVQRVAPTHYMASWIDLPESVAHLRYVPEMIVAMLANQGGEYIQQNRDEDRTLFAVGRGFENNVLLSAFHQGVTRRGEAGQSHFGQVRRRDASRPRPATYDSARAAVGSSPRQAARQRTRADFESTPYCGSGDARFF